MESIKCSVCDKQFNFVTSRNRHFRRFHRDQSVGRICKTKIFCPMCGDEPERNLKSHEELKTHLEIKHNITLEVEELILSHEDFKNWICDERRDVKYISRKQKKDVRYPYQLIYYNCNRSYNGYESKAFQRFPKAGGSKKICGTCPSRITAKIFDEGTVKIKYIKTHVGHEDELRYQGLTKNEKQEICSKLKNEVCKKKILEDARTIKGNKLERLHLLTKMDLRNMSRSLSKTRNADDMAATTIKVLHEWNQSGQNYGFLFKQIDCSWWCWLFSTCLAWIVGERHSILRDEDFAVGFMNQVMESKLKQFTSIICMDGTHNTNIRGWELTTVLVKDDRGVGFPVAFLVSSRKDQLIFEIFLDALKKKVGEKLCPTYFMTDDDPKYYNAWINVMETKPRHLLCSWHIIKNWNIQGKAKLKNTELKKNMKTEMGKILKETNEDKFKELYNSYFKILFEAGEINFLNYLKKHYFQNMERIKMWAHCYRLNAGINTNMAIESLNKFIKYDELNKKRNNTIEKLLDMLDRVVEDKEWNRIIETERPSTETYQSRIVRDRHRKAENLQNMVEEVGFGEFSVRSNSNKIYKVVYGDRVCRNDCRLMYCVVCQICLHHYKCQCPEFMVKNNLCKHMHMVALFERGRYECGLGQTKDTFTDIEEHNYCKRVLMETENEHNYCDMQKNEEVKMLIENNQQTPLPLDDETFRKLKQESLNNTLNALNIDDFKELMSNIDGWLRKKNEKNLTKKRVQETQQYYPKH